MSTVRARWDPPHMPTNPRETIDALIAAHHRPTTSDGRTPAQAYSDALYTAAALPLDERAALLHRLIDELDRWREADLEDQARRRGYGTPTHTDVQNGTHP